MFRFEWFTILVLFWSSISIHFASSEDYCNENCPEGTVHTMCMYPNDTISDACTGITSSHITTKERHEIVDYHNKWRDFVASGSEMRGNPGPQPPAQEMPHLKWDNQLATIAQRWANQCIYGHDDCSNVERYFVNQNIGYVKSTQKSDLTVGTVMDMWYNEVVNFDSTTVEKYEFTIPTAHYTQLVWAKTTHIGCGKVIYMDGKRERINVMCNYGPSGNVIDKPVYMIET